MNKLPNSYDNESFDFWRGGIRDLKPEDRTGLNITLTEGFAALYGKVVAKGRGHALKIRSFSDRVRI
jgi:hypothetical protein